MSFGTILLIVLVLLLIGAIPSWPHSRNWGYGPSGGLGLVAGHHQPHALAAGAGQGAGQVSHFLLGDRQVFLPVLGMAGKAHPHGAVRSPFGGDGGGHGAKPGSEREAQMGRGGPGVKPCF